MFASSQGFGDVASSQTQAQTRTRQEDKQTCIPVTIRILQDAIQRHAESQQVLIHGVEASIVHLVGVVEALVQTTTMLEFQLNDASGRMKVRFYTTGSSAVEGLANGRYVSVVGNLRTAPTGHVSAMTVQASASADDVSYHMIEVAHAALRLRNPSATAALRTSALGVATADSTATPVKPMGLALGASSVMSPTKLDMPVSAAKETMPVAMQTPAKVDLKTAVVDVLKQVQETAAEQGISISALVARLAPAHASSAKVTDVLAQLMEEGDVFNTIDDEHFSLI